jgi:hypothetical protein
MRRIAAIAISIAMLLSMAMPSMLEGAQQPPEDFTFDDTVKGFCAFPVHILALGKQGVIELPGGGLIVTSPALSATLTNVRSGESVTLSITGAFHITTLANGNVQTVYTGRNIVFDPLVGIVLLIGEFTGVADPETGMLVQPLEGTGQNIDLCLLLG